MPNPIVWFEVIGQDADKMKAFYGKLFGWEYNTLPEMGGYGLVKDAAPVPGGIGQAPEGNGWTTFYVGVDDLDATLAAAQADGGTVLMPSMTLPDGGTIAVFADPEGRPVGLFQGQTA